MQSLAMDSTERQFADESPLELVTFGFGENGDDLNQPYVEEAERSQLPPVTQPGTHWFSYQQIYQTHTQFITETNVAISEELAYNQPGLVSGFRPPPASFLGLNLPQVEDNPFLEEPTYPRSQSEVVPSNDSSTSAEYHQFLIQNQQPNVSHPRVKHAPGPSVKPRSSELKLKAMSADRARRLRIASRLDNLQELLPNQQAKEGSKASLLDDVIDYVKYLQLQVKELSQTRLGGEEVSNPFVFLEGYGRYLLNEDMNEPLEEMIGKFLEVNPPAATQLLESRGLFIMPTALAEELQQAL